MLVHDGYTVGRHWKHISDCEERVQCKECGVEESMDHILITCEAPGQEIIRTLAHNIWRKKTKSELIIMKGTIMSCGMQPAQPTEAPRRGPQNDLEGFYYLNPHI